jgi:hypothetical protein
LPVAWRGLAGEDEHFVYDRFSAVKEHHDIDLARLTFRAKVFTFAIREGEVRGGLPVARSHGLKVVTGDDVLAGDYRFTHFSVTP